MSSGASASSASSLDDDEINSRAYPCWQEHRALIARRGFRLDTFRDVKEFYERCWAGRRVDSLEALKHKEGYVRACSGGSDEALCRDAGLPDNLFRGTCIRDGKKVVIKAVHLRSREFDVIRVLSSPPLRNDPMNHTVPVLDLIEVPGRDLAFIVQEEWSSGLISSSPSCPHSLLLALRQCIEGLVFMHAHHIAHLDISLGNVLTDYQGRYVYIDFELSRRYASAPCATTTSSSNNNNGSNDSNITSSSSNNNNSSGPDGAPPRVERYRGTEVPPECEIGGKSCPFKVDIWALGVLILRAVKLAGFDLPELVDLTGPMLHPSFEARPGAKAVLTAFDRVAARIERRLHLGRQ